MSAFPSFFQLTITAPATFLFCLRSLDCAYRGAWRRLRDELIFSSSPPNIKIPSLKEWHWLKKDSSCWAGDSIISAKYGFQHDSFRGIGLILFRIEPSSQNNRFQGSFQGSTYLNNTEGIIIILSIHSLCPGPPSKSQQT